MKKNIFIGPDTGMSSCPTSTPTSNTAVTLPIENEPIRSLPMKKPRPTVRKMASVGYSRNMSMNEFIMIPFYYLNTRQSPRVHHEQFVPLT